jgi:hypothetical protein
MTTMSKYSGPNTTILGQDFVPPAIHVRTGSFDNNSLHSLKDSDQDRLVRYAVRGIERPAGIEEILAAAASAGVTVEVHTDPDAAAAAATELAKEKLREQEGRIRPASWASFARAAVEKQGFYAIASTTPRKGLLSSFYAKLAEIIAQRPSE